MQPMEQASLVQAYYENELKRAKEERDKAMEDIKKAEESNEASRLESALQAALPSNMFRQNSIEEFRYLQDQRKQADRDRREQQRFEEDQANRKKEANDIVTAIQTLNLTDTGTTAI